MSLIKISSIEPWIENFEETGCLVSTSCRTPMMMMMKLLDLNYDTDKKNGRKFFASVLLSNSLSVVIPTNFFKNTKFC